MNDEILPPKAIPSPTEPRTEADTAYAEVLWDIFDECRPLERDDIERLVKLHRRAVAEAAQGAAPHPLLVKYGLESMTGDPIEVLHRHLTNNHAATVGGYKLALERAKERMEVAEGAAPRGETRAEGLDASLVCDAMQAHQDAQGLLPEHARHHCGGTCGYDVARHLARFSRPSDERVPESEEPR